MFIFKCNKQSSITRHPAQQGRHNIFFFTNPHQGTDTKHNPVKRSVWKCFMFHSYFVIFLSPLAFLVYSSLASFQIMLCNILIHFSNILPLKHSILFLRQHPERQKSSLSFIISLDSAYSGCSTQAIYLNILLMESVLGCQNPDLYAGSEQKKAEHFSERFPKQIVWKDAVLFLFVHG